MAQPVIQTSFNAGEWAPALNARVDLAKYHSGAALLRNFFVDYRGGATTCPGTKYILQGRSTTIRLIPFQAAFNVSYLLEFGSGYIRFYNNGSAVLENSTTISAATRANPGVITDTAHGYSNGDWIFISNVVGMTQLNGNFYIIAGATANTFTLTDLNGVAINTTGFSTYTSAGTAQRVYTLLNSPYTANELSQIKFVQNVNALILCHPNHLPFQLVLTSATNWTLSQIVFGATVPPPSVVAASSTLAAGGANYAYVITSNDINGQESSASSFAVLANLQDIRVTVGTNSIGWTPVPGAVSYNVYRANIRINAAVPAGSAFGFVGNVTGTAFYDSDITPDFSLGPPIAQNPFIGSGLASLILTNAGSGYPSPPIIAFTGGGGSGATAICTVDPRAATSIVMTFGGSYVTATPARVSIRGPGSGARADAAMAFNGTAYYVAYVSILNGGSGYSSPPAIGFVGGSPNLGGLGIGISAVSNGVITLVTLTARGAGYSSPPTVVFSSGAAAAIATVGAPGIGSPTVPAFYQQRLVLAAPTAAPQQFNMSMTGASYNFNFSFPIQASDAIQGTLVSGQLSTIQSLISQPYGLIVLSDKLAWLVNGGSAGSAATPLSIVANPQIYNGAAAVPPIVAGDNILYVQSKGSIVRNLIFNYYTQIYTGADISVLSSHLFYGFQILQWAWAEEPFKLVWAVRNDGQLLVLTFLKEQEMVAWAHRDTNGLFKSIATVTEPTLNGVVDAIYVAVQRQINGSTVTYVERMVDISYPKGFISSWQVDAGIGYSGSPAVTFSGAQHLAGATVTGVADGVVINFTMPVSGTFVFGGGGTAGLTGITNSSVVTVGLAFFPQLQTLPLDLGEPTVQGKRKKITGVTLRVKDALGLSMGRSADTALPLQDLIIGNIGSMTNQPVTGFVTGDVRGYMDPLWDVPGQYLIQQILPYPASILGVIPEIEIGDTAK